MAHYAEIDENNVVIRVLVVPDNQEHRGHEYMANDLGLDGTWVKTSYNTNGGVHLNGGTPFRKNYAGVGYKFDSIRDAFISPKSFESWVLDEETCCWKAPVAYPTDGLMYEWNENLVDWEVITNG